MAREGEGRDLRSQGLQSGPGKTEAKCCGQGLGLMVMDKTRGSGSRLMAKSGSLTLSAVSLGLLLPLFLLELHVAKVQEGPHDLVAGALLIHAEAQDVHGVLQQGTEGSEKARASQVKGAGTAPISTRPPAPPPSTPDIHQWP